MAGAGERLVAEELGLEAEAVRAEVGTPTASLRSSAADDEADVVIWNPDGSKAELSGNGTRIAARWLAMDRAPAGHRAGGPREVAARVADGEVEQGLGAVTVAEARAGGRRRS